MLLVVAGSNEPQTHKLINMLSISKGCTLCKTVESSLLLMLWM